MFYLPFIIFSYHFFSSTEIIVMNVVRLLLGVKHFHSCSACLPASLVHRRRLPVQSLPTMCRYQQLKAQYDMKTVEADLLMARLEQSAHHRHLEEIGALKVSIGEFPFT